MVGVTNRTLETHVGPGGLYSRPEERENLEGKGEAQECGLRRGSQAGQSRKGGDGCQSVQKPNIVFSVLWAPHPVAGHYGFSECGVGRVGQAPAGAGGA